MTDTDMDLDDVVSQALRSGLNDLLERNTEIIHKAEERIASANAEVAQLTSLDVEKVLFTVKLYDPYEQTDSSVTERSLPAALKACMSSLRSNYDVTVKARLPQLDVTIPEEVWLVVLNSLEAGA